MKINWKFWKWARQRRARRELLKLRADYRALLVRNRAWSGPGACRRQDVGEGLRLSRAIADAEWRLQ